MATYTPTSNSGTDYTSSLAIGDIIQGNYTGSVIPITVPAGKYKLECYGAQGGTGYTASKSSGSTTTSEVAITDSNKKSYFSSPGTVIDGGTVTWTTYNGRNCIKIYGNNDHGGSNGYWFYGATVAGTYRIYYAYSTETNYDKLTIAAGSSVVVNAVSGTSTSWQYVDASVASGEHIDIIYEKDGSVSSGSDTVWVAVYYLQTTTSSGSWSLGSGYQGGYGGYSVGTLSLTAPTTLYLYTGGKGTDNSTLTANSAAAGGFNGGGSSKSFMYSNTGSLGGGGGGASDIRIGSDSLYSRVIVAGGGGGSAGTSSATEKRGGGTTGASSNTTYQASQTAAGTGGGFGTGGSAAGSYNYKYGPGGGGGGWYGGGAHTGSSDSDTSYRDCNGGGSGYVYTSSTASNYPSGCTLNSDYYLTDASTTTSSRTGNGIINITVIELITEISNGSWTYLTGETLLSTSTLQTTSSWTLTGTNCKKFTVIPQESGYLKIYSNGNIDTYGYIGTTDSTTIGSNGAPTNYDSSNDDNGDDYGASYGNAFGFYMPVTANTRYYLWVRPYSSSNSASVSISHQITAGPKLEARYLKIDSTTWVQI